LQPLAEASIHPAGVKFFANSQGCTRRSRNAFKMVQSAVGVLVDRPPDQFSWLAAETSSARCAELSTATAMQMIAKAQQ
jgi:hypothetical protein